MDTSNEHSSPFRCDAIALFVEDTIMYVFTQLNLLSHWQRKIHKSGLTKLFSPEIGREVMLYADSNSEEFRSNYLFNWDFTRSVDDHLRPGYFYEGIADVGCSIFKNNGFIESTYYFLAMVTDLCVVLAIGGQQNLIYYIIRGAEFVLHHLVPGQFPRRYWFIARYALLMHDSNAFIMNPRIHGG